MGEIMEKVEFSIPEGVTEITAATIPNHRAICSVHIPEGVLVIGENAFADCVNLKEIEIPSSVVAIERGAFKNCAFLNSIEIPAGITTITAGSFADCVSLESITLPDSITGIKERAFAGCTGIKNIVIPDNLTECARDAFPNSGTYLPTNKVYRYENGMMLNTSNGMLLFYNGSDEKLQTPAGAKGIGRRAFYNCNASSIRVSEGVTSISDEAFAGCLNKVKVFLPESVDYIELSAFDKNTKIYCRQGSYAEGWCRNGPFNRLADERISEQLI